MYSGPLPDPPRLSRWLFARLVRRPEAEYVLGDLEEEFRARHAAGEPPVTLRRWYRHQLLRSLGPLWSAPASPRPPAVSRSQLAAPSSRASTHRSQRMLSSLWHDVRYTLRSFLRQPGIALTALATLALGIGANTAVFSVVNGVLLRPLPYPDPGELVTVSTLDTRTGDTDTVSGLNFLDWSARNDVLDGIYAWGGSTNTLTDGDRREQIEIGVVTPEFLDVLGVTPRLGRGFAADEVGPGRPRVALLSDRFWRRRYGGDPEVPGRTLSLDGESYEIIGVTPPGFQMPLNGGVEELWITSSRDFAAEPRDAVYLSLVGRLADGVPLDRARQAMDAVHAGIRAEDPVHSVNTGVALTPLKSELVADVRWALAILLGAVGFLLLLACANVANLFLARAAGRGTEFGVRTALGAGSGRLTRQLLTESAVVAAAAGALGILAALAGVRLLTGLAPDDLPRIREVSVDGTVLGFSLLATALTGLLFGAVPALWATRRDPMRLLRGAGRGQVGDGGLRRIRELIVIAEIAAAAVLVVGAGLLARSFAAMLAVDPGFDASHVVTAEVLVPRDRYPDAERRAVFFQGLMRRLEAVPGVEAVGGVWNAPMGDAVANTTLTVEGRPRPAPRDEILGEFRLATGGYFDALRIPVLSGRVFDETDTRETTPKVVISRLLAEQLWPGESPVGRRFGIDIFETDDGTPVWYEVIGVVGDTRLNGLDDPERPLLYIAYSQRPQNWITVTARTRAPAASSAPLVRDAILDFEPLVPDPALGTMEGRVGHTLAARRFYLSLLVAFAVVAIALASVGIYGVLAYAVSRRTNEIGVRVAFGASRGQILRQVVLEGMRVAALGIALGLLGAWALSRTLASLVYGISLTDPVTYGLVVAFLGGVALLACVIPARRAATVDPIEALRYE